MSKSDGTRDAAHMIVGGGLTHWLNFDIAKSKSLFIPNGGVHALTAETAGQMTLEELLQFSLPALREMIEATPEMMAARAALAERRTRPRYGEYHDPIWPADYGRITEELNRRFSLPI